MNKNKQADSYEVSACFILILSHLGTYIFGTFFGDAVCLFMVSYGVEF